MNIYQNINKLAQEKNKNIKETILLSLENLEYNLGIKNPYKEQINTFKSFVRKFKGPQEELIIYYNYFFIRNFSNLMGHQPSPNYEEIFSYYYRFSKADNLINGLHFFCNNPIPLELANEILINLNFPLPGEKKLEKLIKNSIKNILNNLKLQTIYEDLQKIYRQKLLDNLGYKVKIRNYDKKQFLKLKLSSPYKLHQYNEKTKLFYQNFFGTIDKFKPGIYLCSSGNEANEIVLKFLQELIPQRKQKLYVYWWYYENTKNPETNPENYKDIFSITNIAWFEDSSIPGKNYQDKRNNLLNKLKFFIEKAKKDNKQNYYIIWDITSQLDKNLNNIFKNIPTNLKIIITSSLSKFQDDESNFFFGIISAYNLSKKETDLLNKTYDNYSFYPYLKLSPLLFPRISKSKIKLYFKNIEENKKLFLENFENYEEIILGENRFSIILPYYGLNNYKKLFIKTGSFGFSYTTKSYAFLYKNKIPAQRIAFGTKLDPSLKQKAQKISEQFKKSLLYKLIN